MNTLLKASFAPGMALALGLCAVTPAIAQDDDIFVRSPSSQDQWVQEVSRDLDRRLVVAETMTKINPSSGIVQIRFQRDEQGRPVNLDLYRSSGHVGTDRSAMWAVRRLRHLDEAPGAIPSSATFQANIIFAENQIQKADFEEELLRSEKVRMAAAPSERAVIALGSW